MKMLPRYSFLFFALLFNAAFGQNSLDSIKRVLKIQKEDTFLLQQLVGLSVQCEIKDILLYAEPAVQLADKLLQQKAFDKRTLLKGKADAYNNIGFAYNEFGNIAKCLEYYHKSLEIQEEIGDKSGIATLLNNIGYIYVGQSNLTKAGEYYNKSMKIRRELNDKRGLAESLNNFGTLFQAKGDISKALGYHSESLKIREEIKDNVGISQSLNNLGVIYNKKNDLSKALDCHFKSLALQEEANDKHGMCYTLINLAVNYQAKKNFNIAEGYCKRSLQLSKEIGAPENIKNAAEKLSNLYSNQGKYKEAYVMHKLFKQMADSVSNVGTRNSAVKKEMQYDFDKKTEREKASNEKREAIAAEEKQKQKIIIYSVSTVLLLVLTLTLFVFRGFRQKQKINHTLAEKNKTIEEKNKDILDSIKYAKRIQEAILPPRSLIKELLPDSFIVYKPKDIVSGDFYFLGSPLTNYGDKLVVFGVADCTGHGVPGAFLTLLGKTFLQLGLTDKKVNTCADALDYLNRGLTDMLNKTSDSGREVRDGMDISLCSVNYETLHLEFAGAKNSVYVLRKSEIIELKANKHAIGELNDQNELLKYSNKKLPLEKGDIIYAVSDGLVDQFGGPKGKKFMYSKLKELFISIGHKPMQEQSEIIIKAFEDWKGKLEQVDDVCLIGVRI